MFDTPDPHGCAPRVTSAGRGGVRSRVARRDDGVLDRAAERGRVAHAHGRRHGQRPPATPRATCRPRRLTPRAPARSLATLGSLTGAWKGTWTNTSPQTAVGTFVLTWAQQGNLRVRRDRRHAARTASTPATSAGNLDGTKISFGAVEGDDIDLLRGHRLRHHHDRHVPLRLRQLDGHLDRGQADAQSTAVTVA